MRGAAGSSFHTYQYPFEVLARHPDTPQAIVNYPELVASPRRTVEQVYRQIGFTVSPAFDAVLLAEEKRARSHETTHTYSLEEFGLQSNEIHKMLADFFERFGWDKEAPE